MNDSGFIVPPPGLIPPRPKEEPGSEGATPVGRDAPVGRNSAPARSLPAFTPPSFAPPAAPGAVAPRPVWRLHLAGERSIPVTRTLLVGRNPSRSAYTGGASDLDLIALDDPTSTVSKTHAALIAHDDGLTVTDLHSTNGVVVGGVRAEPGRPVPIDGGTELLLGDLRIRVERS
jgi:FHA domain-containing protein